MLTERWTTEEAQAWYAQQPWLVGCNFVPSTAVNQLEMWQAETFDPETIERELGWAASLGFNTVRVYLHDLIWTADADGFLERINRYLGIAEEHGIRTTFVFFDACWNNYAHLGTQPKPIPGVHNSGWVQSPSAKVLVDPSAWDRLEAYVKRVISAFGQDERVLMWDLYNEPGNEGYFDNCLPLLTAVITWAREQRPSQPLTVGVWDERKEFKALNAFQLEHSDVITFHNYEDAASLKKQIEDLQILGRPVICTEYMARTQNSRFETHLPIFKEKGVGCYNWGLVSGKTQTIYPWNSPQGEPKPEIWFHDLLHPDGTPFDQNEVVAIHKLVHDRAAEAL